ncbi:MAG: triose-phosphate isomerase [Candidatus Omnitrophica bacterium]|nr:triose-phosphate isomerase [Candidatus Omnitrophota bacterium]
MRTPIIAGNWKLNKTSREAIVLVEELKREVADLEGVDIVVCPPFTALESVSEVLTETNIALGAQNVYWADSGAFTGEISTPMLKDFGVQYVIVGHSERRQYFGETNETVNKRLRAALAHGLTPIVCVGENLAEREADQTFAVLQTQVQGSLAGLPAGQAGLTCDEMNKIVVAYEPVWAIGTGKTATPSMAQEAHAFVRGLLAKIFGPDTAQSVRIQYGGSVTPENIAALMSQPDIDGALVGGASLKAASFAAIINAARK